MSHQIEIAVPNLNAAKGEKHFLDKRASTLEQLKSFGFPEHRCEAAVIHCGASIENCVEW